LKPVVVSIRSLGIRIVIYLDDILLLHQNKNDLVQIFYQVVNLFQNLGFTIKREKCSLHPTQQLVFLGGLLDTMKMTISLPPEKLETIIQEAYQTQQTSPLSLEKLSSLIGRMSHAAQTGAWRAPLYYRSLHRDQAISTHQCGQHRKRFQVTLSQASMTELIWWSSPHLHTFNGQLLRSVPFDLTISTDASLLGCGASWNGVTTGGRWLPQEGKSHNNWLELKAAYLGL
jgi:hypothetical protein